MNSENTKAQMRKGVLEMCVLGLVAKEAAYPSDMISQLKTAELIVVEGTLYPLLSRLKKSGLVDYYWQESPAGPPRKYYQITETGTSFLEDLTTSWKQLAKAVNYSIKNQAK
jgi:PadR family transcriptional regulator PadR